ncbi:CBO0543 family protein [Halobacillus sp. BBL2006]|uniref:CBO0543 family protein n=1 Tax=Halobacillus sp. BBL2006 TaxID=1543706 RepID=UPI0012E05855|nr:CBO0543 family protein [Halobacillus sp. BBL2006]
MFSYLFTMVSAALLTTYIELWFIGQGYYNFHARPFPAVFPVDIRFTLIVIPLFSLFALWIMKALNGWTRFGFIFLTGLLAMLLEPMIEEAGWIAFSSDWKHIYSFFGYSSFLLLIRLIHVLVNRLFE